MAKKKTLPTFDVVGTLDELLPVEMLLVMSGYDKSNEWWNNSKATRLPKDIKSLTAHSGISGNFIYYYASVAEGEILPASDLNAIAKYIEDYGN